jgi:hypothetical protein
VLAKYLIDHGLSGFFDAIDIESGDILEDKLEQNCLRSFAFVQFVERQMMVRPVAGKRNWCWEEYCYFEKARKKIDALLGRQLDNFYIITPFLDPDDTSILFPARLDKSYRDWFAEIVEVRAERLSNEPSQAKLWEQFRQIATKIAAQRIEVTNRVLYH